MDEDEAIVRRTYEAFNARDLEGALRHLSDQVTWSDGEGGTLHGKAEVRKHWVEQWSTADPTIEVTKCTHTPDTILMAVRLRARTPEGAIEQKDLENIFRVRAGLIDAMRIPAASGGVANAR
jgi:ketosteroid isomerase-like protein